MAESSTTTAPQPQPAPQQPEPPSTTEGSAPPPPSTAGPKAAPVSVASEPRDEQRQNPPPSADGSHHHGNGMGGGGGPPHPPPPQAMYGPPPPHMYHMCGPPPPPYGQPPGRGGPPPPPPPHMMGHYPPPPPPPPHHHHGGPWGYPHHMMYHPHHMGPPPPPMGPPPPSCDDDGNKVPEAQNSNMNVSPNPASEDGSPTANKEDSKDDDNNAEKRQTEESLENNDNEEDNKGSSAGPSVTKVKKASEIENATPTTVNETLSEISPSAFASGGGGTTHPSSSGGGPPGHIYHTHQKPHYMQGSPPTTNYSHGSFSRISGPPSGYYAHPPPPLTGTGSSGSGNRMASMPPPPPPHGMPYVYQYQHFDPRSDVDAPMPPNKKGSGGGPPPVVDHPYYAHHHAAAAAAHMGGVNVPPTVHMPSVVVAAPPGGAVIKDIISPLPNFSAIKTGKAVMMKEGNNNKGMPSTPRDERRSRRSASAEADDDADDLSGDEVRIMKLPQSSPLELLSSVSSSPAVKAKSSRHHNHSRYSYPPPPGYEREYGNMKSSSSEDVTSTPSKPKSLSACDLLLSAANTMDIEDIKANNKKKRKLTDVADVKRKLHKNNNNKAPPPTATNLFSVGGYPPGFDPTTLPPSRTSMKVPPKSQAKKMLDPTTVDQAHKATILAQQALERPRVGKQLLLSMALVRSNPRTPPSCYPAHGTVLTDRFHWAAFPPLDMILRKNMKKYYELSTNKCQSRDQQEFNNELVSRVRTEARKFGWEFDDRAFDDKKIRDRVRCFYKTHIQNAKKRLKTMLRNPEKRANIKALASHFHLIEEKGMEHDGGSNADDSDYDDDDDDDHRYHHQGVVEHDNIGFGLSQSYSSEVGHGSSYGGESSGNNNNHDNHYGAGYRTRSRHRNDNNMYEAQKYGRGRNVHSPQGGMMEV